MSQSRVPEVVVNKTPVAFFDFDGTLTTGDTLMPFLKFVVGKPRYYWYLLLVSPMLVGYFLKLIRNDVAKEAVLKRYLSGYCIDELFTLGERFSKEVIPVMLRPEGMERLKWHQQQGHDCVLVSASFDIWLKSWADENDFNAILTTSLIVKERKVIGKINGVNCYGQEKVERIKIFLRGRSLEESYAYGDTVGDHPMLEVVGRGFIFNENKFTRVRRKYEK